MEQVRFGLHFLQLIKFKKTRPQNEALLLLEKLAWQGLQPKKNKKLKSAMRNLPILQGRMKKSLGKENLRHQVASIGRRCRGVAGAEVDGLEGL